jgi:amino acid adenylation domain-containing protein
MSRYILTPVDFDPFEDGKEIDKIVNTNEPQREIWLSCAIGGDESSLAYNESVSLNLKGEMHPDFFIAAIHEVVARHESLRATVSTDGESLIIYKQIPFDIGVTDFSGEDDQQEMIDQFITAEMHKLFDLQEGPLFRAYLHKLNDNHYYFTMVKHHVIGDGWSTGVILEDLSRIYNAKVNGIALKQEKAPQISQYEAEMTAFKNSSEFVQTENYWLDMYKDSVPVLDMPVDFPRPARRTYHANRIDQSIAPELVDQLKKTGAKSGCSLVNTLLSAFEIFLHLQTRQHDIVVGLPAAGQAATGHFGLVGHCVNVLPLKSSVKPEITFSDYLKERKSAFFDAYDNQKFTFGQLVNKLNIKRDPSRIPLVPVLFNIDMGMDNSVAFENLSFQLVSNPRAYETFELFLNATGSKSSFILEWSYNIQLFKAETIHRMSADFEQLLKLLAANPSIIISELSADHHQALTAKLEQWNDTKKIYPKDSTLPQLISEAALKYPNQPAVVFSNTTLTYAALERQSSQLAACLIEKGIRNGDLIGLATDRSADLLVCLLGILKAGAAYIPLDPEYPQDRIEYMLEDSNAKMLLVSAAYRGKFHSSATELVTEQLWTQLKNYPATAPAVITKGTDLAYVLYTSGSTGKPKGVQIKHHNLVNFLLGMQEAPGMVANDRLLAVTTISFDIAGLELYLPLITGATVVLCDQQSAKDGRLLLELITQENITVMQATPSTWGMMIAAGWNKKYALKVLCGGEALPKELAASLLERATELWNMYGPTETTIWSTVKRIENTDGPVTIGRPIQNTQVYILDENHQLLEPGATGELLIGGEGVAAGYLNRPELTAERFINNPFNSVPGDKLYKTGDLARFLENGEIMHQGRMDEQVKIRGYRIELGEIETLLSQQDGIKQAVVLAREDTPGDKRLVGYVTLQDEEVKDITPTWKDHWDTIYDIAAESQKDVAISEQKIDGIVLEQWQDSGTLLAEAKEWLAVSVDKIKAYHAQNIYEIGCGGGQLMFEIAPFAKSYLATDYSPPAIEKLKEKLEADPGQWKHVSAKSCAADDFTGIPHQSFDLIIIHSVAQYFPDTAYLLKVIEEAVKRLKDGGCLYIGDIQGMNCLEMEHAMNQITHSKAGTTLSAFKEIVENRVRIENELAADPGFFYLLPDLIPSITGVDIELRKGKLENQTTRYHYDCWIYVNSAHQQVATDVTMDGSALESLAVLKEQLQQHPSAVIAVNNIYNARTDQDCALMNWIASNPGDTPIDQIKREMLDINEGYQPDLFWELGGKLGYNTFVRWSTDGTDGLFDAVFIPANRAHDLPVPPVSISGSAKPGDYARTPIVSNEVHLSKTMVDKWKQVLRAQLPDYMVPADLIGLKAFPLTPNKKIDKKAFPKPQRTGITNDINELPHDEYQKTVSGIWSAVLGIEQIGIHDDFFELGGHSLLAVRVMTAIEKETGKRLPLATLFEHSTIEKLALKLNADLKEEWNTLVPIKTTGTKDPVYMIHGGGLNVLFYKPIVRYMNEDQPIYGFQALGLNKVVTPLNTLEEIAAAYITDLLKANPEGPYALTGYSFGGLLAFEMAKQLVEMGKKVKFVGIVDTYLGLKDNKSSTGSWNMTKKVMRQFTKIPFLVRSFIDYPQDAFKYQLGVLKYKINQIYPVFKIPKVGSIKNGSEDLSPYEIEIYKTYAAAHKRYKITPAPINISLLRVKKRIYFIDDPIYLGWKRYAKLGISVFEVPGDHASILHPPNDKEFARVLQAALDQA